MDWNTPLVIIPAVVLSGLSLGGLFLWLEKRDEKKKIVPAVSRKQVADIWLERKYFDGWEVIVNNEPLTFSQALHYMHILQEKTGWGLPPLNFERNWNKVVR